MHWELFTREVGSTGGHVTGANLLKLLTWWKFCDEVACEVVKMHAIIDESQYEYCEGNLRTICAIVL